MNRRKFIAGLLASTAMPLPAGFRFEVSNPLPRMLNSLPLLLAGKPVQAGDIVAGSVVTFELSSGKIVSIESEVVP